MFGKIIAGTVGGLIVAVFGFFLIVVASATSEGEPSTPTMAF